MKFPIIHLYCLKKSLPAGFAFAALFGLLTLSSVRADESKPSHYPYENLQFYKDKLDSYVDSGNYEDDIVEVVAPAQSYLKERVRQEALKPAEMRQKLAIVLDIDETSLSNIQEIRKNEGYGFYAAAFNKWNLDAKAPAIKPTLRLYHLALDRGVKVFFVTGRRYAAGKPKEESEMFLQTLKNLHEAGYEEVAKEDLYLRPDTGSDPYDKVSDYKSAQRIKILRMGYRIILDMGDQYSDLADTGSIKPTYERAIKIPNPFYFLP